MYIGKNPTALKSQKRLCVSLTTLMNNKPYKKISIKELTEHSQLSRQTFYQLFDSKEEILSCLVNQLLESYYTKFLQSIETLTSKELSQFYLSFSIENESFIKQLFENNLTIVLLDAYIHSIKKMKKYMVHQDLSEEILRYHSTFIAYGLVGIIYQWFEYPDISQTELQEMITHLVERYL